MESNDNQESTKENVNEKFKKTKKAKSDKPKGK